MHMHYTSLWHKAIKAKHQEYPNMEIINTLIFKTFQQQGQISEYIKLEPARIDWHVVAMLFNSQVLIITEVQTLLRNLLPILLRCSKKILALVCKNTFQILCKLVQNLSEQR